MIPQKDYDLFKNALDESSDPLYIYDNDADGLASFLLLSRYKKGRGVLIKPAHKVSVRFDKFIQMFNPDKVFILDAAIVDEEFIQKANVPLFWIDHHTPLKRSNISYLNPRVYNPHAYLPTTYLAYQLVNQDLWIAMTGCVADWYLPPFKDEFNEQFPGLFDSSASNPDDVLYNSRLGTLTRVFSFILKGKNQEVHKAVNALTKVVSPYDILDKKTPQGKFVMQRYEYINGFYQEILKDALVQPVKSGVLLYLYHNERWSFTADLANELTYHHPKDIVIVARQKSGQMKCSIRSRTKPVADKVLKSLEGLQGTGGGHENACGAVIDERDFDIFMERMND